MTTYHIAIRTPRRKDFDRAIDMIKDAAGGTYDPASKTWTVETDDNVRDSDRYRANAPRIGEAAAHIHAHIIDRGWGSDMPSYAGTLEITEAAS